MDDYLSKPINITRVRMALSRNVVDEVGMQSLPQDEQRPDALGGAVVSLFPAFELSGIRDLVGGDEEQVSRVVSMFRETTVANVAQLESALQDGVCPLGMRMAHTIKSAGAYIQAHSVVSLAREIEAACRNNDLEGARVLTPGLVQAVSMVCQGLDQRETG